MSSPNKNKSRISLGLIVVFLFSAAALPIIGSLSDTKKIDGLTLKSLDGSTGQSAPLPLAEKESEEKEAGEKEGGEENLTEKGNSTSPFYFNGTYEKFLLSSATTRRGLCYATSEPSSLPIYLSIRALLIWSVLICIAFRPSFDGQ